MRSPLLLLLCFAGACSPRTVPWGPAARLGDGPRGMAWRRAIVHLHSALSHDACDGAGYVDGVLDGACVEDLRRGLCEAAVDVAFLTDHPDHAASQPFAGMVPMAGSDRGVGGSARLLPCDEGGVTVLPGVEDELMPLALDRHVVEDVGERQAWYNRSDAAAVRALGDAGAAVFVAHTEGRDPAWLAEVQAAGGVGVEIFNLHAMFAPDIREERLGLDRFGWVASAEPFTSAAGDAEPDLLFLAVLQDQSPSLARWDALLSRGPAVGVFGTDAHQNVLPLVLRDGERGDSYRRMLGWMSNWLLVEGDGPQEVEQALRAGRVWSVFDVLGQPEGLDVRLEPDGGATVEVGGAGGPGRLIVGCPSLAAESPRGALDPEVRVEVWKDGAPWREGCGRFSAEPGVYRVRVEIVPHHLRPFLGSDADPWVRPYPWAYSNAIRVGG